MVAFVSFISWKTKDFCEPRTEEKDRDGEQVKEEDKQHLKF